MRHKLNMIDLKNAHSALRNEFIADVRIGLCRNGQKELPPKYFYDDLGSALFDAITHLPEYGLTRADVRLLVQHSRELADLSRRPSLVTEFGSGSGAKTRWVIEAIAADSPLTYCPIDISPAALRRCESELSNIGGVEVSCIEGSYLDGLRRALRSRDRQSPVLLLFLGSSIGNLSPSEIEVMCRNVRAELQPGDVFLISTDLEKEIDRMLLAYDDPVGVTAAFNKNVLARMNRELAADFDLSLFEHEARYDRAAHRIEMHLRSQVEQVVHFGSDFSVHFLRNETIWTESSYKFRAGDLIQLARRTGFTCKVQWIDREWPFAQSVFIAD
jgi:L-histidine Nalpha-methyltransferase